MKTQFVICAGFLACGSACFAQNHGLNNAIRGVVIASGSNADPNSDVTHTATGTVGPLSTSTFATYFLSGVGGTASGSITSDFGLLTYSALATANTTPGLPGQAYLGGLGGNTGEDYDKLTVVGTPGGTGTFQLHLHLDGMDIQSQSIYSSSGVDRTGILSSCFVHFDDGSGSTVNVWDYLDTPSSRLTSLDAFLTFNLAVGHTFRINHSLRAACIADPAWDGIHTRDASASVYGQSVLDIRSLTSGIDIVSESGHVYDPVPEPTTILGLSLGALSILRRRRARK